MLLVQNVHPFIGTEQIWHCEVEFKKYIDLHSKHKEFEEQMEHPDIAEEQSKHWGGVVAALK